MSIGKVCIREVDTAGPNETAVDAARRMRERKVGTLVVVDDQRRPMGLVTDRDIAMRVVAAGRDASRTPVTEIMTAMPTGILETMSIESALENMRSGRLRRLPVINGAGALVGIVTLDDILALISEEFSLIGGVIARESPHRLAAFS
jgi:CBS domain-containing protein